jgi:hypothetical protein
MPHSSSLLPLALREKKKSSNMPSATKATPTSFRQSIWAELREKTLFLTVLLQFYFGSQCKFYYW